MPIPFDFDWRGLLAVGVVSFVGIVTRSLLAYLARKGIESLTSSQANVEGTKRSIIDRIEAFLFIGAANIAEKRLPELAARVVKGDLKTQEQVKKELYKWGEELKAQAIAHFTDEKVDIVSVVGEQVLDQLLESAANKVSPLPGMKTSAAILMLPVAEALVRQGIEYVRRFAFELVSKCNNTQKS